METFATTIYSSYLYGEIGYFMHHLVRSHNWFKDLLYMLLYILVPSVLHMLEVANEVWVYRFYFIRHIFHFWLGTMPCWLSFIIWPWWWDENLCWRSNWCTAFSSHSRNVVFAFSSLFPSWIILVSSPSNATLVCSSSFGALRYPSDTS